jgi:serine/threonine-protein kinase PRP4
MMETKGKFNVKMLKNCTFLEKHFDNELNFLYETYDKASKKNAIKKMQISITAERELLQRLRKHGRQGEEGKKIHNFKDFLEKCLALNPKDRLIPEEAFLHSFLNYQVKLS